MTLQRPVMAEKPGKPAPKPRGFVAVQSLPILYVNMPKSGCTTIKNILYRIDSGAFLADPLTVHKRKDLFIGPDRTPDELARRLRSDLVFTFVRHPLKRAYSCFNEKVHFETKYSFGGARQCIADDYGGHFVATPSLEQHRANFKAFLRFARDSFKGENGWRRDPHWCPQSMVVNNVRRWRAIDFIGRVENFDAHLKTVMGLAGISYDFETPRMNEGPPPPFRYEEVLDDEVRSLGRALFASDLRIFGYSL
jgi:Sulfotransferase family